MQEKDRSDERKREDNNDEWIAVESAETPNIPVSSLSAERSIQHPASSIQHPASSIQHPVRRNPPFHLCARFADYYAQSRDRHPYRAIALWRDEAITPNCAPIDSQRCSTAPFCSALRHHDSEPNLHFKSGLSRIGIQLQHGITTSSGTCRSGGRRSRGSLRPSSVRVSIRSHPERAIAGVPPSPAPSSM